MIDLENNELWEEIEEAVEGKKYSRLRQMFLSMEPADIAIILSDFPEEQLPVLFRLLPKELAAETFVEFEPDAQEVLITGFSNRELKAVLDEMYRVTQMSRWQAMDKGMLVLRMILFGVLLLIWIVNLYVSYS